MSGELGSHQEDVVTQALENSYKGNIIKHNDISNAMNQSMLPMFLTLSSYVGAMIGAIQMVGMIRNLTYQISKRRVFAYIQCAVAIAAVASALVSAFIVYFTNGLGASALTTIVGHQILNYIVFFNFCAFFIFLFGANGMLINLPLLLAQTIAGGATMTRALMNPPFEWLSYVSPMYYSNQGLFADIFGNISSLPFIGIELGIGVVVLLLNYGLYKYLPRHRVHT